MGRARSAEVCRDLPPLATGATTARRTPPGGRLLRPTSGQQCRPLGGCACVGGWRRTSLEGKAQEVCCGGLSRAKKQFWALRVLSFRVSPSQARHAPRGSLQNKNPFNPPLALPPPPLPRPVEALKLTQYFANPHTKVGTRTPFASSARSLAARFYSLSPSCRRRPLRAPPPPRAA